MKGHREKITIHLIRVVFFCILMLTAGTIIAQPIKIDRKVRPLPPPPDTPVKKQTLL
jgi:hypothetical protein